MTMETFMVRALYDFTGEPNTSELSISAGQVLTVSRTDVGEGWWEGSNESGKVGLFPQAYVERIDTSKPPTIPPPELPPQTNAWDSGGQNVQEDDWDDDWDDDTYSEIGNNPLQTENYYSNSNAEFNQNSNRPVSTFSGHRTSEFTHSELNISDGKGSVTKKSLNPFSSIGKSGLESYILGTVTPPPSTTSLRIRIRKENDKIQWDVFSTPYTVQIAAPKKATKMGGLKSFIEYHVTPSFSNITVARRYKHFDWLHGRLRDKFNVIAVPPLPDKQISGRYEEQFIEHRRLQIQEFINYMCQHPVLSTCEVWQHFLTCTDEKQWKSGKRNAEKDTLVGANFCLQIEAPDKDILSSQLDNIDQKFNYILQVDQCFKGLMLTALDQQKKCSSMYKREYAKIGESFFALGAAFEIADKGMYSQFTLDIKKVGSTYCTIGKLFEEQARVNWQSLSDKLYIYKGITGCFNDIFALQKQADQKKRDCERAPNTPQSQLAGIRKRNDVLTYAVFAELSHFQDQRDVEIRKTLKKFLQEQLDFYKNVVIKLEDCLHQF